MEEDSIFQANHKLHYCEMCHEQSYIPYSYLWDDPLCPECRNMYDMIKSWENYTDEDRLRIKEFSQNSGLTKNAGKA